MRITRSLAALSFVLTALSNTETFADDFQMRLMGSNPEQITFCDTENAAAKLSFIEKTTHSEERASIISKAKLELGCHSEIQAKEYTLHKSNFVKLDIAKYDYEILDILYQPNNQHKFIDARAIGPYTYIDTSCKPDSSGGQVNRMEADKNGRLYLKKYMVTSTCVNGKNTAVWKPLN